MALPKDENGMEITKGDLVLYKDGVFKIVDWEESAEEGFRIEIKNTKSRAVTESKNVVGLGLDLVTELKKSDLKPRLLSKSKLSRGDWVRNEVSGSVGQILDIVPNDSLRVERWIHGKSEVTYWSTGNCHKIDPADWKKEEKKESEKRAKSNHPNDANPAYKFYVGDRVYNTDLKEVGKVVGSQFRGDNHHLHREDIRVEIPKANGILVEDWDARDCIISHVDSVNYYPSQGEVSSIFGGGYCGSAKSWDRETWPGLRRAVDRSYDSRTPKPKRKPEKKHSITTGDLISKEVRRLQNEERRDKILGGGTEKESPKPKIKTRKGSW